MSARDILESFIPEQNLSFESAKVGAELGLDEVNEYSFDEYTRNFDSSAYDAALVAMESYEVFNGVLSVLELSNEHNKSISEKDLAVMNAEIDSVMCFGYEQPYMFELSTESLMAKTKEKLKNAGAAIASFIKQVIKAVGDFFNRHFTKAGRLIKKFEVLEAKAKDANGSAKNASFKAKYNMLVSSKGDALPLSGFLKFLTLSSPDIGKFESGSIKVLEAIKKESFINLSDPFNILNKAFNDLDPVISELFKSYSMKPSNSALLKKMGFISRDYANANLSSEMPGGYFCFVATDTKKGIVSGIKKAKSTSKQGEVEFDTVPLPQIAPVCTGVIKTLKDSFSTKKQVDSTIGRIAKPLNDILDRNLNVNSSFQRNLLVTIFRTVLNQIVSFVRNTYSFVTALADDTYSYMAKSLSQYTGE